MKKLSGIALLLAGICIIMFQVIGYSVSADGVLHEPFFLIPLMYFFLFIAIVNFVIVLFRKVMDKKR